MTYPQNTVWYVECRPWSGARDQPGNAPPDPIAMGSAVVVEIEHLDENRKRFDPPKSRKYLLTCAHVVRQQATDGALGWGAILEEIHCWQPGMGYSRTYPDSRKSGSRPGVWEATVSRLSPCGATPGDVSSELRLPQNDWVLLEVKDPKFQTVPSVRQWGTQVEASLLRIIGFPGGAGWLASKGMGHFWDTGDLVESTTSESFRQTRTPEHGKLELDGPEETRPGMSGGGVFDAQARLVGMHRSSTDASMERGAVSAAWIKEWLLSNRNAQPVDLPARGDVDINPRKKRIWLKATLIAIPLIVAIAAYFLLPPKADEIQIQLLEEVARPNGPPRTKPFSGALITFVPVGFKADKIEPGLTSTDGKATLRVFTSRYYRNEDMHGRLQCIGPESLLETYGALALIPYGQVVIDGIPQYLSENDLNVRNRHGLHEIRVHTDWEFGDRIAKRAASQGLLNDDQLRTLVEEDERENPLLAKAGVTAWLADLRKTRPVLSVEAARSWTANGSPAPANLDVLTGSVCAIFGKSSANADAPTTQDSRWVGTGFLVGNGLVLTASFVADALSSFDSVEVSFAPTCNTESSSTERHTATILQKDKNLQVALLDVPSATLPPLPLAQTAPATDLAKTMIFVVGYPAHDSRLPPELESIFGDSVERRSIMPGEVIPWGTADFVGHDATTAGGVSGGPVVDWKEGVVMALHLGGRWAGQRKENYAIPIWKVLGQDSMRELIIDRNARLVGRLGRHHGMSGKIDRIGPNAVCVTKLEVLSPKE